MEILLGLVAVPLAAAVILLAMLRAGIRRQERSACLACRPRSLSAALARRVLGLHVRTPAGIDCPGTAARALIRDTRMSHS